MSCFILQTNFVLIVSEVSGQKQATLILDQHFWGKHFMKTGSRVKIGISFLVRGTLLILINNVLVKCYCEVFFCENESLQHCYSLCCLQVLLHPGTCGGEAALLFHWKIHHLANILHNRLFLDFIPVNHHQFEHNLILTLLPKVTQQIFLS